MAIITMHLSTTSVFFKHDSVRQTVDAARQNAYRTVMIWLKGADASILLYQGPKK